MSHHLILLPSLAHIALIFWLYVMLARAKAKATQLGQVDLQRRALHHDAWPDAVVQINNNIRNQFELPVLFHLLVLMLWGLHAEPLLAQSLAWLFVCSRFVHTWIHTGANIVLWRRRVFTLGWLVLLAIWMLVVWAVLKS